MTAVSMVCRDCRSIGQVKRRSGPRVVSILILVSLLVLSAFAPLFLLIAIVYAVIGSVQQARDRKTPPCPKCGHASLIPCDTPEGQRLVGIQG